MTAIMTSSRRASLFFVGILVCVSVAFFVASGQEGSASKQAERDVEFVSALIQWGFPDYARKVSDNVAKVAGSSGGGGEHLKSLDIQMRIHQKKFDEAIAMMEGMDASNFDSWRTLLGAADLFYGYGKWDELTRWYDKFLRTFSTPSGERMGFYKESAYKYAQLLKYMKKTERALEVYEYALKACPDTDDGVQEKCQMWTEMAQICLRMAMGLEGAGKEPWLAKAKKYAEQVQWKDHGVWFGKTVVIYAQIEAIQDKRNEAMKVITSYLPILTEIHEQLKAASEERKEPELLKLTPMAECRYLLASLYYEEGERLLAKGQNRDALKYMNEALQHAFNVFVQYPSTTWAPQAGKIVQNVFEVFDRLGVKYRPPSTFRMGEVLKEQMKEARTLQLGGDVAGATAKYSEILELFPEYPGESVSALASLAECYFQFKDEYATNYSDHGQAVIGYIAERFGRNPKFSSGAGDALLTLAGQRKDRGDTETAQSIIETVVESFTNHPQRVMMVLHLGDMAREKGDLAKAMGYYRQVKPEDSGYDIAASSMAAVYKEKGDHTNEIAALEAYIKAARPGYRRVSGQYRLATAKMNVDDVVGSAKAFNTTLKMITAKENNVAPEDQRKNGDLLETTLFNTAASCSRIKDPLVPQEDVPKFQQRAIDLFGEFAEKFPASTLRPSALLRRGILQVILKDAAGAAKTFEQLGRDHRSSDEARARFYVEAKALLEMGYVVDARRSVEQMLASPDAYTAAQFMDVGKKLVGLKESDVGVKVFRQAISMATGKDADRAVLEGGRFWLAEMYFNRGQYKETIEEIDQLFAAFPRTGHTVEASFMLSKACAEVAGKTEDAKARRLLFNKAVESLNAVTRLKSGPLKDRAAETDARISVEVGWIYELKAKAADQFRSAEDAADARRQAHAAYYRLFEFSDLQKAGVQPYAEQGFFHLIPYEMAAGNYADVAGYCAKYLDAFAEGKYRNEAMKWLADAEEKGKVSGKPETAATNAAGTVEQAIGGDGNDQSAAPEGAGESEGEKP